MNGGSTLILGTGYKEEATKRKNKNAPKALVLCHYTSQMHMQARSTSRPRCWATSPAGPARQAWMHGMVTT